MTLTEFLLARIAEDEAVAKANPWHTSLDGYSLTEDYPMGVGVIEIDPRRVLAEGEAKRRIVEGVDSWFADQGHDDPAGILRALASVYADHPDYDPEWA